jgi:hypothetical protein
VSVAVDPKPLVFVSYSRHDEAWRKRVEKHLGVLDHELDVWSDERITLGDDWRYRIRAALESASAAVLLVSADFLTSPFIRSEEVPALLERRRRDGVRVVPVIVQDCAWRQVSWLASMQAHPRAARPLAARNEAEQEEALTELARQLGQLVGRDRASFADTQAAIDAYRQGWQAKLSHLDGDLLDDVTEFLTRVDSLWPAQTAHTTAERTAHQTRIFGELCAAPWRLFGALCHAAEDATVDTRDDGCMDVAALLTRLIHSDGAFSLYFAASLLRAYGGDSAHLLPTLLRHAWDSGLGGLWLEAVARAGDLAGVVDETTRAAVVQLLKQGVGSEPFVNTYVFDALASLRGLDPPVSHETARTQIELVLAEPDNAMSQAWAYAMVGRMFEDVLQGTYWEVIETLAPEQRAQLYAMAALATARDDEPGFFQDFLIRRILGVTNPYADKALRALVHPPKPSPFFQKNVLCFGLVFAGLALRDEEPPRPTRALNDDEAAWQIFGEIEFWLNKFAASPDRLIRLRERCGPLWQTLHRRYACAAVHPLRWLESQADYDRHFRDEGSSNAGIEPIVAVFPAEVTQLLMHAAANLDKLTSVFGTADGGHRQPEMTRFAIETLGRIGPLDAIALIEPFADHPEPGRAAVTAIRSIRERAGEPGGRL